MDSLRLTLVIIGLAIVAGIYFKFRSSDDDLIFMLKKLFSSDIKSNVDGGGNPRDAKFILAEEIIERFHSEKDAISARENFIAQFSKGAVPDDIETAELKAGTEGLRVANLLKDANLVSSTSEGMRMIKQGAVKFDGEKVTDAGHILLSGADIVVQVGKRKWARVKIS